MIGIGIGIGSTRGGTPRDILAAFDPAFLLTTPLVCDGSTYVDFSPGALSETANYTICVSFKPNAADAIACLVSCDDQELDVFTNSGGSGRLLWGIDSASNLGRIDQPDANAHYTTALFRGGEADNASRLRIWLDGVEQAGSITYAGTIPAEVSALTAGRVGARSNDAAEGFIGTIYAVAIYATDQSSNLPAIHGAIASLTP
jgi:hypothetical protein